MFTLGLGLVVFAIRFFAHSMRGAFEANVQRWHLPAMKLKQHQNMTTELHDSDTQQKADCSSAPCSAFDESIAIATGCLDYGGGYRGTPELEIYHHGIQTVINALKAAKRNGRSGTQVNALVMMGESVYKDA